jgi:flagellar hook-associated protein 1 FlgK
MADMLSVAVSGLKAFQRALDTTSHNIANASTPGYSRQTVNMATNPPQTLGTFSVGTGVSVGSIDRSYDAIVTTQLRTSSSGYSRLSSYAEKAEALNNLFSDTTTGLSASLQKFVNAIQGVANTPNSTAARQVLLSEAQGLTTRLQSYDQRLDSLEADVNSRLANEAVAITSTAAAIARLNEQIVTAQATTGQAPNDLLDARDKAVTELAAHVNVSTVAQGDGAINVFIGTGQSLVLGSNAAAIATQGDPYDPTRLTLVYQTAGGTVDLRGVLSGGSVGGLMDFRREMLDPARNQLGQIAIGLASAVNAQHREGMDLRGAFGGDLFAVGAVAVSASTANSGTGTVSVTRTSAGALTPNDYVLQYSGSAWSLRDATSGATVAMTGAGTVGSPFVADGLAIVVGGTPASGDRYLVQPTASAIQGMSVLITDPAKIAAAVPIRTAVGTANVGGATISAGEVLDPTNAQLRSTVQLQFIDATHYSVNGSGSFVYTAGGNVDINGWRVAISGAPQAGDTFTIGDNAGGVGDNRNALELASVLGKGVLSNGAESLGAATSRFVGGIGVATNQAQMSRDAQEIIHDDAVAENDSVGGVNLDEEAANLLRYQQAYQAAAQVIRVTQEMFDALLNATRR